MLVDFSSFFLHNALKERIMKKIMVAVLSLALAAGVFAGGAKESGSAGTKPNKDNLKVGFIYIGSIHDEGYTQAHDRGRLALEKIGVKCAFVENVPENADCEKAIRDLIDQGV